MACFIFTFCGSWPASRSARIASAVGPTGYSSPPLGSLPHPDQDPFGSCVLYRYLTPSSTASSTRRWSHRFSSTGPAGPFAVAVGVMGVGGRGGPNGPAAQLNCAHSTRTDSSVAAKLSLPIVFSRHKRPVQLVLWFESRQNGRNQDVPHNPVGRSARAFTGIVTVHVAAAVAEQARAGDVLAA